MSISSPKYNSLLLYCFLLFLSPLNVQATDDALLWRITHPQIQGHSYLFATMHSNDPQIKPLLVQVLPYLQQSKQLMLETLPSGQDEHMLPEKFSPDKFALLKVLSKEAFVKFYQTISQYGLSLSEAMQLQPWMAVYYLGMNRNTGNEDVILDIAIYYQALLYDKMIYPLETAQEQLSVYYQISQTEQIALLKETLAETENNRNDVNNTLNLYLKGHLTQLLHDSQTMINRNNPATQAFMQRLIPQRNVRMLARMLPHLNQGRIFIAVGALHLPGKQGLIKLLRQQQFTLTPIPLIH